MLMLILPPLNSKKRFSVISIKPHSQGIAKVRIDSFGSPRSSKSNESSAACVLTLRAAASYILKKGSTSVQRPKNWLPTDTLLHFLGVERHRNIGNIIVFLTNLTCHCPDFGLLRFWTQLMGPGFFPWTSPGATTRVPSFRCSAGFHWRKRPPTGAFREELQETIAWENCTWNWPNKDKCFCFTDMLLFQLSSLAVPYFWHADDVADLHLHHLHPFSPSQSQGFLVPWIHTLHGGIRPRLSKPLPYEFPNEQRHLDQEDFHQLPTVLQ